MNNEQKHKTLSERDDLNEKLEETSTYDAIAISDSSLKDAGEMPIRVYGDNQDLTPREHSNILHILSAD